MTKIITPIRPHTFEEFVSLVEKINNRAKIIEIWLDKIWQEENFFKNLEKFIYKNRAKNIKYLGVCKTPAEKGEFCEGPDARIKVLKKFLEAGGDFADLDFLQNSKTNILKIPMKNLFLSYHNFIELPKELNTFLVQASKYKPYLFKFAVTINTEEELETFLKFIKTFPQNTTGIFTTMGKLGKKGREEINKISWPKLTLEHKFLNKR